MVQNSLSWVNDQTLGLNIRLVPWCMRGWIFPSDLPASVGSRENTDPKTERPCRGDHERGRCESRLSGRSFTRHCSHVAAGRGESIRHYMRHISRRYQRNKPCEQCRSFRRRRRATRQGLGKPPCPGHLPNRSTRYHKKITSIPCDAANQRQATIWAALLAGLDTNEFSTRRLDRLRPYTAGHSSRPLERLMRYRI